MTVREEVLKSFSRSVHPAFTFSSLFGALIQKKMCLVSSATFRAQRTGENSLSLQFM